MPETILSPHRPLYDAAVREVRELLDEPVTHQPPMVIQSAAIAGDLYAHPRELVSAMVTWMCGVFMLTYMLLPLLTDYLGLFEGLIWNLPGNAIAFVVTMFFTVLGVLVARPAIQVHSSLRVLPIDPFLAATSGSLLVWAVMQNTIWGLTPFTAMAPTELSTFLLLNLIESGMFGLMLASLANGRTSAFLLGGLFQLLFMGTAILLIV